METNRGGRQRARPGLLAAFRRYIADLDARSRANLHRHAELREVASAEREQRESELRMEAEIFVARLPRWLRPGPAESGTSWVAAVDLALQRRRGRPPFVTHAGRSWVGLTLPEGTALRMTAQGAALRPSPRGTAHPDGRATITGRSAEDRPTPPVADARRPGHRLSATCITRTFEVLDGPLAGRMIEVAADPAGGFRRQALTAAAMVAPAGERIAEVPSAAHSVLLQLQACQRQADHADAILRHWRHWAWAHAPAGPREADVREAVDRPTAPDERSPRR